MQGIKDQPNNKDRREYNLRKAWRFQLWAEALRLSLEVSCQFQRQQGWEYAAGGQKDSNMGQEWQDIKFPPLDIY